jgi:hypothetical protein
VLYHDGPIAEARLRPYRAAGAEPVTLDDPACREHGVRPIGADLAAREGLVRHDSERLARAVVETLPAALAIDTNNA